VHRRAPKDLARLCLLLCCMSQVVDFGDPYMEMLSIFLRLLAKVIADSSWSVEVDLSEVFLVGVPGVSIVRTVTNAVVAGRLLDVRG
jgi:type I restriction enzyme R subunit